MSENPPINLYYDVTCTQPIPRQTVRIRGREERVWTLDFGYINGGDSKQGRFYVRNETDDDITEFETELHELSKEGVNVTLLTAPTRTRFNAREVIEHVVQWTASDDVQAGPCRGLISFAGYAMRG